jgi:two-component system chemotaxis response regulator CheY
MARVLVVEDSAAMRVYVAAALERVDELPGELEVIEAQSGFDALRLLPRGRYDLVVTDINMPDINGLELIRFLRKSPQHKDVPVLVISTSVRDKERGLSLGADAFLEKPFSPDAFRDAVRVSFAARTRANENENEGG